MKTVQCLSTSRVSSAVAFLESRKADIIGWHETKTLKDDAARLWQAGLRSGLIRPKTDEEIAADIAAIPKPKLRCLGQNRGRIQYPDEYRISKAKEYKALLAEGVSKNAARERLGHSAGNLDRWAVIFAEEL